MTRPLYLRTQPGTAIVLFILVALAVEGVVALRSRNGWSSTELFVAFVLTTIGVLFSKMTIAVFAERIEWWFAFGFLRQTIVTSRIDSAGTKRVSLLNGLGIRTDGRNWLWTVGGNAAVTFTLRDGRQVSLGSPDAPNVASIVNDLLRSP
jgi:hypothetical protein